MTKPEFLAAASAAARSSSAASGLPAGVTVAQAALESAWGNSQLARDGQNYFGIKFRPGLDADYIELPTVEVIAGTHRTVLARFAKFPSMEDCFRARDHIILAAPCYAAARAAAHNPQQFIAALAMHWATDPEYAAKLLAVYRSHQLAALD
jgi:flagellum-specific peptidoglycan hydrolase FlgJ